jgi:hypothetical protein
MPHTGGLCGAYLLKSESEVKRLVEISKEQVGTQCGSSATVQLAIAPPSPRRESLGAAVALLMGYRTASYTMRDMSAFGLNRHQLGR